MKTRLFVLTGASGAGKTTIARAVRAKPECGLEVFFFDSIGVPSKGEMERNYGSGEAWQKAVTFEWIERLAARLEQTSSSILLEGQMRLAFIREAAAAVGFPCSIILVDCSDEIRARRLAERGQSELDSTEMSNWATYLRQEALADRCLILDTGSMSVEESVKVICALV